MFVSYGDNSSATSYAYLYASKADLAEADLSSPV